MRTFFFGRLLLASLVLTAPEALTTATELEAKSPKVSAPLEDSHSQIESESKSSSQPEKKLEPRINLYDMLS